MKLPTYLTTVTPLSKAVALSLFIFFPIVAFILGLNFGYYGKELEKEKSDTGTIQLLKQQLIDQDQEMDDIISNRGTFVREYDTSYKDEEFGLQSPFFENKPMHVIIYKYKRTLITRRHIQLDPDIYAITWTYELIAPNTTASLVIFDGALENHGLIPIVIEDFKTEWEKEKPYISNNRNLNWAYGSYRNTLTRVHLEGLVPSVFKNDDLYHRLTPTDHIFFRLTTTVEPAPESAGVILDQKKAQSTLTAKESLMKIADQISYRKTN